MLRAPQTVMVRICSAVRPAGSVVNTFRSYEPDSAAVFQRAPQVPPAKGLSEEVLACHGAIGRAAGSPVQSPLPVGANENDTAEMPVRLLAAAVTSVLPAIIATACASVGATRLTCGAAWFQLAGVTIDAGLEKALSLPTGSVADTTYHTVLPPGRKASL
jgi:hypothetical protein